MLKGMGFDRGLARWHFAGDFAGLIRGCQVNLDELRVPYLKAFNGLINAFVEMDGSNLVLNHNQGAIFWTNPGGERAGVVARLVADFAKTYGLHLKPYSIIELNFHLNIIIESGHLTHSELRSIKRAYAGILGVKVAVVNYSYTPLVPKIIHVLKYVTRATFRDYTWDERMAAELYNFRNMRSWGSWKDEPVWELEGKAELEPIAKLESGLCPVCGEPVSWSRAGDIAWLKLWAAAGQVEPIGAGYYELLDIRPPPG
ncbi:unnamed protein product, partial [marine sediment metagenome]